MSKPAMRLLSFFALLLFGFDVGAQQPDRGPILGLGNAVVSGFSGTITPDPSRPPAAGKTAVDFTFINPDGPSARIVGIDRPGFVWDGRLFPAPKTFDVRARDVGQVFGIALDDQANIYLAATSAFGLHAVLPGRGRHAVPERIKKGRPGAVWMKGQFGLDLQGGPGSIYKVDGRTGEVTLFANVMLDGVPNPGPGLGNLAYDSAHKQLLVSDLYTGMIHRFGLDGQDLGSYDHGVTGRPAVRAAPVPFDPRNRLNVASPRFDTENPHTWGFAPPTRRVWGLAVHDGRLYYSARNGQPANAPQIWSVGLQPDGGFGADPRLELEVAGGPNPYPVSDIAFSQKGAMLLAQRAPIAGSYDYSAFTAPGEPRVLRTWLKDRNDPPSPGRWKPAAEEYAVGFAGTHRNSNGGVALGYGYGQDGALGATACEGALWTTGQNLRNDPALRSRLEPGGALLVHGLQGSPADQLRSANEPPWTSYAIDYDDTFDDARASGHIGSVRILARPCAMPIAAGSPPHVSGPQGGGGGGGGGGGCVGPDCNPPPLPPIDLAIKKTAGEVKFDPATLTWTFTFTLTVTNAGIPFTPGNLISINDPVPPGLTFTSATGAGWTCSGSLNCGYNFGPGIFTTGASLAPLVITVTSKTPGKYENCATVGVPPGSGLHETTLSNNKDCATVELEYPPNDVTVVKANLQRNCSPEMLCSFTITVTNNSPWPFNGAVSIGDNAGIAMNVAFTDLPCPVPPTAMPFTCTAQLSLPAGVSSQTFSIIGIIPTGSIAPTDQQALQNCATIGPAPPLPGFPTTIVSPGQDCKPYVACGFQCHMKQGEIDQIKIEKIANATQCSPGGLCSYTFTVTNMSTTTATSIFPITFVDTMPAGATTFVPPPTPAPWSCLPFGGNPDQIKCLYPPSSIPAGGQLSVTVTFQIAPGYNQHTLTNCSEFFIGTPIPPLAQRRSAAEFDARALRAYLQSRGIGGAVPVSIPPPVLGPDDKSCTTVDIVQTPVAATSTPPCPPGTTRVGRECVRPPQACTPPMVSGPVPGVCMCPQGTVQQGRECVRPRECRPPFVPNAAGTDCVCRDGLVRRGQRCVPPLVCTAPMVLNSAGTACACPAGTVRRGRECVRPIVCTAPAKANRAGTACVCPSDMVARGNGCVERERERPRPDFTPGGGFPRIPGGGSSGPRGGDTGGPRGGPESPRGR